MITYKVSFVVTDRRDVGTVQTLNYAPEQGDLVLLDSDMYEVTRVLELMPPKGKIFYLQAICRPLQQKGTMLSYARENLTQHATCSV